jgi:hypothetical protein
MKKRALLNITVDTDDVTEEPLTASDLLMRTKLMAYAQKLAAKEQKKKLKQEKAANKAAMLALGLPPAFWPPATPSPANETVPGFWLYTKSVFLSKLFNSLAAAASTLPGVNVTTTQEPISAESTETPPLLVNEISKRSPYAAEISLGPGGYKGSTRGSSKKKYRGGASSSKKAKKHVSQGITVEEIMSSKHSIARIYACKYNESDS